MFKWSTKQYINEVENGTDPGLQEYQQAEIQFITSSIKDPGQKTFVDVGAGYGRVVPHISPIAKKVIAVEIDDDLLAELFNRVRQFNNLEVIDRTGDELSSALGDNIDKPVLLSLQNTLGPWEGNRDIAIAELRRVGQKGNGELIVSLFCREAIKDWGLLMYASISGLVGNYDPTKSDLLNGYYCTDRGYKSYWFDEKGREELKKKLGGHLVNELKDHKYHIFHISYN